jgi:GNAT superfamily N-acetyltransferase
MQIGAEPLTPVLEQEISALVTRYYDTTKAHVRLPPYDFVWSMYRTLQTVDKLLIATARDNEGVLVGVAMYLLTEHPHHRGLEIAECDTLAVDHKHRGQGIGRTLYVVAESMLIELGVKRVLHRYRTVYDETPMFPKMGFTLEEHVYMKDL